MMKLSKYVALVAGCSLASISAVVSPLAAAQEPTKEETIAWLQQKIAQASLGCVMNEEKIRHRGTHISTTFHDSQSQTLSEVPGQNGLYALNTERNSEWEKLFTRRSPEGGQSSSAWSVIFSPSSFDFDSQIELKKAEDRGYRMEETHMSHVTSYSCHIMLIPLKPFGVSRSGSREKPVQKLAIEFNEWSLAERIKSALEHWKKLEQSGVSEPF